MDPVKLLKQQHALVKELFEKFEDAEDDRDEIFQQIADNFAAHSKIEEKLFYPAVYVGDLKDKLLEAVEEHLSVKRVIADLLEMESDNDTFDAKVKVLKEQIEHHVEEEENELFPKSAKVLDKEPREELGDAMAEMFEREMEGEPSSKIPAQTDEAAPLH